MKLIVFTELTTEIKSFKFKFKNFETKRADWEDPTPGIIEEKEEKNEDFKILKNCDFKKSNLKSKLKSCFGYCEFFSKIDIIREGIAKIPVNKIRRGLATKLEFKIKKPKEEEKKIIIIDKNFFSKPSSKNTNWKII